MPKCEANPSPGRRAKGVHAKVIREPTCKARIPAAGDPKLNLALTQTPLRAPEALA